MRYSLRARTKLLTHEDTNDPPLKLKKKPEKGRKKIKKQTKRERLSKKMLAQKLRRAKIKLDPKLHEAQKMQERERWKRRRAAGKVKLIHDMTPREKRIVRMRRKISARKHSAKQLRTASEMTLSVQQVATAEVVSSVVFQGPSLAEQQTPSISCYCAINKNTKNIKRANQKNALRKKKKNISKTYQRCVTLEKKFTNLQRTHWRLLKTQKKSEPLSDSPPSRINREFKGRQLDPITKKRLIFGEVLKDQIAESANNKSTKTKQAFYKLLSGKVIKKYRMLHMTKNMLSRPLLQKYMKNDDGLNYTRVSKIKVRHTEVKEFYARDDISSKCPDKKAYVISYKNGKMKKRKRILQGKLTDLYSKYSSECSQKNVKPLSYTVFCRLKPFFVVHQKASERDTCLCKYCENFTMKVEALHRISVIRESTPYKVMSAVTCNAQNDDCLIRKCVSCKDKSIDFSTEVSNETIVKYSEWDKNVDKKTVKVDKSSDLLMFKSIFLDSLITYQHHYFKQKHQHEVLKNKRENLADGEIYIHCDFSENYGCKYTKEIQPMYYGGNREEISIHTGVLYTKNKSYAFCTLSRNGRHDAPAIWAHLLKVFKHFMPKFCGISKVHIQRLRHYGDSVEPFLSRRFGDNLETGRR
ncbi:uncharacterized protein LOC127751200 [Frankliniella occidentalis]|uniref:Uncharacterized protein LOC127751200 n=1 Tax=Frankliniella occidentalis TaxID=133901 RepID=A0A9C6X6Q3_FRAOC|nr:uncharacterized protein LOC127751200 [Frankliniella occidentalis]